MLKVYIDTSVFGGCFDEEFMERSLLLIEAVRSRRIIAISSEVVVAEIDLAPPHVREVLESLPGDALVQHGLSRQMIDLRNAYLEAGILGRRHVNDATHVAVATVARADAMVSWNFRHIVRLDKMRAYNKVNLQNGYGPLTIVTPREVMIDEA